MTPASGILLVDKPAGPTSHDAVAAVRRALRIRQVGHTGTLDPFASGLLVTCFGTATRLAEYLVGLPKTYRALIVLGASTDTDDRTGQVLRTSDAWRTLDPEKVHAAFAEQVGTREQLPPAFSAKKVAGERMYVAAREGRMPERTPVPVTVYGIRVLRLELPEVEIQVECGKGTYIRAIARDVGETLGVGGHLGELRRTRVGPFAVDDAVGMDRLGEPAQVQGAVRGPGAAVAHLPRVELGEAEAATVRHGGRLAPRSSLPEGTPLALWAPDGALLAIAEQTGGRIQPRKVLA